MSILAKKASVSEQVGFPKIQVASIKHLSKIHIIRTMSRVMRQDWKKENHRPHWRLWQKSLQQEEQIRVRGPPIDMTA